MNKIIITIIVLLWTFALNAQTNAQGEQHLYYEQYVKAETTYHQLLLQQPTNAEAWYGLVTSYHMQEKFVDAKDSLALAPAAIHEQPFYKIAKGAILMSEDKPNDAKLYFDEALKGRKSRKNPAILEAIAKIHINSKYGDPSYAIELLEKAIKRSKHDPSLEVLKGDAYRKLKNGNEAYRAYQIAVHKDKNYAQAYHHLGELFMSQNNPAVYIEYFRNAITADADYAPSLYELYLHEFNRDPAKAMDYYTRFLKHADRSIDNEYDMADLLYLNHQYDEAIAQARSIIGHEAEPRPRLFKLVSYSYAEKGDTASAIKYMETYFEKGADSNFIAKDYLSMGDLYQSRKDGDSLMKSYYKKAIDIERDTAMKIEQIEKMAKLAEMQNQYDEQAQWLARYYALVPEPSNVDLFNWGLAHYRDNNFTMADSVFTLYTHKYREQSYGYYWLAKVKSLQDSTMEKGIAVPVYKRLVETLQQTSSDKNYKPWIVTAYAYLAAYEANTLKNYEGAIEYFEKLLEVDPENSDARDYIAVLRKSLSMNNK